MTKKENKNSYKRPSEKRAEEITDKSPAAKEQKDSLKKPVPTKSNKTRTDREPDVTDKHHDS